MPNSNMHVTSSVISTVHTIYILHLFTDIPLLHRVTAWTRLQIDALCWVAH